MVKLSSLPVPPLSPYGMLHGSLFQYNGNLVAFESSPPPHLMRTTKTEEATTMSRNKCILLGGLSDGLMPVPYTVPLERACHSLGWSLVQPVLSSSYLGFGNGSLERDTEELSALMWYLTCHREGEKFCLVGHSTGCQNSMHFLKHGAPEMIQKTKVVALQAPVSDREHAMLSPDYESHIHHARTLVKEGKELEMMPRNAFWAPITARRFLDLQDVGGADDFFSSDLTEAESIERLSHVGQHRHDESTEPSLQVLVAFSGADEFVPSTVDSRNLVARLCQHMNFYCPSDQPVAIPLYLSEANHNLSESHGDAEIFVQNVAALLAKASSVDE